MVVLKLRLDLVLNRLLMGRSRQAQLLLAVTMAIEQVKTAANKLSGICDTLMSVDACNHVDSKPRTSSSFG